MYKCSTSLILNLFNEHISNIMSLSVTITVKLAYINKHLLTFAGWSGAVLWLKYFMRACTYLFTLNSRLFLLSLSYLLYIGFHRRLRLFLNNLFRLLLLLTYVSIDL